MLEFESKIKKWGNSFGLVVPKRELYKENFKDNEEFHIIAIKKNDSIRDSFGMFKGWKMSGQKAKNIIKKELHNA